jgi:O-antigen/teichoic acid export membrane protein
MEPQHFARDAAWSFAARLASQLVLVAGAMALARLVAPELFGLVGMQATVVAFAAIFADAGLSAALVHRPALTEGEADSALGLAAGLGLVLSLALGAVAPAAAAFYGAAELTPLVRVGALGLTFTALGVVPRALLVRSFRVREVALLDFAAAGLSMGAAIALALLGAGVWALAAMGPISAAAFAVGALHRVRGQLRLGRPSGARALLAVALPAVGFSVVNYAARNVDNVLIGRWLGERELAFYARAYTLMLLPMTEITGVLANSMLPALARLQHDPAAVRREYLRALRLVTFVTFPAMAGLAVLSWPFVRVAFGPAWDPVAPILAVLAVVGGLQSMVNPVGWLYQSHGRTDRMLRWGILASACMAVAIAAGAWRGSGLRVAWAYLAVNVALLVPAYRWAGRVVSLRVIEVLAAVAPVGGAAALMALGVWALDRWAGQGWPALARLLAGTAVGLCAYLIAARLLRLRAAAEASALVRRLRPAALRWIDPVLDGFAPRERSVEDA